MIKVSIVTISYNQEDYLEECILSILDQDYQNIEYILVDPGSTDSSRFIVSKYQDRITKLVLKPDSGPAHGLNNGFLHATGQIFFYLNADDLLLPGAVSQVVTYFEENPEVDICLGSGIIIDANGVPKRGVKSSRWSLLAYAYGAAVALQQATFFRSSAFNATDGFNVSNDTCWDGELLVDMVMSGAKIGRTKSEWGAFRYYLESISGSGENRSQYLRDQNRVRRKILGRGERWYDRLLKLYYWIYARSVWSNFAAFFYNQKKF
jgi:glycosyltransferase involved in cell wall biosynthesis